ncbi:hypothetical protein HK105_209086 [Polyrhizophydium stewartii]|uniref:Velvet domain-containing protein n=1 Tax=Polyrhizophydium stewartii TaxID=2732419 RepID=A0ABR4MVY7_9FUNG
MMGGDRSSHDVTASPDRPQHDRQGAQAALSAHQDTGAWASPRGESLHIGSPSTTPFGSAAAATSSTFSAGRSSSSAAVPSVALSVSSSISTPGFSWEPSDSKGPKQQSDINELLPSLAPLFRARSTSMRNARGQTDVVQQYPGSNGLMHTLFGNTTSGCYKLSDFSGHHGAYFLFPELCLRIEGQFRLKFSLFDVTSCFSDQPRSRVIATVLSEPFRSYNPRIFPGMQKSPALLGHFFRQGAPIIDTKPLQWAVDVLLARLSVLESGLGARLDSHHAVLADVSARLAAVERTLAAAGPPRLHAPTPTSDRDRNPILPDADSCDPSPLSDRPDSESASDAEPPAGDEQPAQPRGSSGRAAEVGDGGGGSSCTAGCAGAGSHESRGVADGPTGDAAAEDVGTGGVEQHAAERMALLADVANNIQTSLSVSLSALSTFGQQLGALSAVELPPIDWADAGDTHPDTGEQGTGATAAGAKPPASPSDGERDGERDGGSDASADATPQSVVASATTVEPAVAPSAAAAEAATATDATDGQAPPATTSSPTTATASSSSPSFRIEVSRRRTKLKAKRRQPPRRRAQLEFKPAALLPPPRGAEATDPAASPAASSVGRTTVATNRWELLPKKVRAKIVRHAGPLTMYLHGQQGVVALEQVWADLFDQDWKGDLTAIKHVVIDETKEHIFRIRTRDMLHRYSKIATPEQSVALQRVAIWRRWHELVDWSNVQSLSIDAATCGDTGIIETLVSQGHISLSAQLADAAASSNQVAFLRWLHERAPALEWSPRIMDNAASFGHLGVVRWLHENGRAGGCTANAMDWAAMNGRLPIVKFLHEHRTEGCTTKAMDWSAINGHLETVRWLHEHRTEGCTTDALNFAAARGHLAIVQFLHEHRTEGCTSKAMDGAALEGRLEVFEWLHRNRTEGCSEKALELAASKGHIAIVRYIMEHGGMRGDVAAAAESAVHGGHEDVARYLAERTPQGTVERLIIAAIRANRLELVQWLIGRRKDISMPILADEAAREGVVQVLDLLNTSDPTVFTSLTPFYAIACPTTVSLEWLLKRHRGLFVVGVIGEAMRMHAFGHLDWLRRNVPELYAQHPVAKISSRVPSAPAIEWLAAHGGDGPLAATLHKAIEQREVQVIKWVIKHVRGVAWQAGDEDRAQALLSEDGARRRRS